MAGREAAKPTRTTLFCKAGPGGTGDLGDCPFAHSVQMALALKGADWDTLPVTAEDKPQWLLDECEGKMPCLVHDGKATVETSVIVQYIEANFPGDKLSVEQDPSKAWGVFPAIAVLTKNKDPAEDAVKRQKLVDALSALGEHLSATGGPFLAGAKPTLPDVDLATKLYCMQHSTRHYAGFDL
eukprot:Hpha_TRINITY_DN4396_c0_g2::TRINITY_DN4396_c0_g2_i1::g.50265::m.50265/K05021/CLIC1; chloride intracellular channel protein 1